MRPSVFTEADDKRILRLASLGRTDADIAAVFCRRTADQVRSRRSYLQMTAEQRARRRDMTREARQAREGRRIVAGPPRYFSVHRGANQASSMTVPDAVLAERDRALVAPRTLTALVFGDPPPGRSALDKIRGQHG